MRRRILFLLICLMGAQTAHSQGNRISGTVTSFENHAPVFGVSVIVKGTTVGTITDRNGFYQLDLPFPEAILAFSYLGMKSMEMAVEGNTVNVELHPESYGLEEVMVVAYGKVAREAFVGSAALIKSERLEKFQTSNVTKALQGLVSGVLATSGSGQPGEGAAIRIRGINSFNEVEPLIVVDGFPYGGDLSSLPVGDIESVTVLKDATATALYGSRAAAGVIIITTRKGAEGASKLEIITSCGISGRAVPSYQRVSTSQYYELMWEALRNSLLAQGKPAAEAAALASGNLVSTLGGYNAYQVPDNELVGADGKINPAASLLWEDDWGKEAFVTGYRREVSLRASGAFNQANYFASVSALDEDGIVKASDYKRYAARLNLNAPVNRWIDLGMSLSGAISGQNYPENLAGSFLNIFKFTREIPPVFPVYEYDRSGNRQTGPDGTPLFDFGKAFGRSRAYGSAVNPLATAVLDKRQYTRDNVSARSSLAFQLAKGLEFNVSGSVDYLTFNVLNHENSQMGAAASFKGRSTRKNDRSLTFSANQLLRYDTVWGQHHLGAMAGHESFSLKINHLEAIRSGFPLPGLFELNAAAKSEGSGSYEDNYRIESYLAKVDYNYAGKYYANLSIRRDGNSIFHQDRRWADFWSAGVAWKISEEEFLKELPWLNTLRLKASYGEQGNDKIGTYYAYQGLYEVGWNNVSYPGMLANRLPTPDLTWESLKSANIGAEMKFLHRFLINLEYYRKDNSNLLFAMPLSPSTGFGSVDANIAQLRNEGFELDITTWLVKTPGVEWSVELNFWNLKNRIMSLSQQYIINGTKRWEVGRSVYDFWLQEYAGVNPETGKSRWYKDEYKTGAGGVPERTGNRILTEKYSEATRYYQGSSLPGLMGGVASTIQAHGFDLSVFANYALGGKVLDRGYQSIMHSGQIYHWHQDILGSWTPENRETTIPVLDRDQNANAQSSRFLTSSDYFSLRNITLGYQLPANLLMQKKVSGLRLFLSGDNLLLASARRGLDPRQSIAGTPLDEYTPVRTITFGLNVTF